MREKTVTIIGGSGFLGRHTVREFARAGWRIRVICRRTEDAAHLKTAGDLGQIFISHGDLARPETIINQLAGSDAVVNLVGILYEGGRQRFGALHGQGPEKLAQAARQLKVPAFLQVSSLGVDKAAGASDYARTKMLGEKAVRAAFPDATILRPSVMFGPDDDFLNKFGQMAMIAPALPLIGKGKTLFQPAYVGDVARAIRLCVENTSCRGRTIELGGPDVLTFRQILELVMKETHRSPALINLPFPVASVLGSIMEWLPKPPLTLDQVRLLRFDNIVDVNALNFASLSIHPMSIRLVAPEYLARYRKRTAAAYA